MPSYLSATRISNLPEKKRNDKESEKRAGFPVVRMVEGGESNLFL